MSKDVIHSPDAPAAIGPYSQAVKTGLVVFTTLSVGLIAYWLVPGLPLAMAFALGALVSPTDAVAVSAIVGGLPIRCRSSPRRA